MKQNILTFIKKLFGWPLGLIALYFILRIIAPQSNLIFKSLENTNYWLILFGCVFLFVYFIFRAILWYLILKEHNSDLSFKDTVYGWTIAEIKRYIPGSIWAIGSRVLHFSDKGLSKKEVSKAWLQEAQLIILGSFFSSLVGLHFILNTFTSYPYLEQIIYIVSFGLLVTYLFFNKFSALNSSLTNRLYLLCVSIISFFFFGLGHFILMYALIPNNLQLIYILSGFFSGSFLVGYLSFITPTGIGVREAMITYGLHNLLTIQYAGFIAIFSHSCNYSRINLFTIRVALA